MGKALRVLILEDSEDDAQLFLQELRRGGYDVKSERVFTARDMKEALDRETWNIVLADYRMPQFTALDGLKILKEKDQDIPFIIISGTIGEETAVEAMKLGAHDYLMKGNLTRLNAAIERELDEAKIRRDHRHAQESLVKINQCFLSLEPDFEENVNRLTALCGELLGATCALYNCLDSGMLYSLGQWNTPPGYKPKDKPEGHICYDVISQAKEEIMIFRNLPDTTYAHTDPNVKLYNLKTYIGKAVRCNGEFVGSLCAVFQSDYEPSDADRWMFGIIANAIGSEERRRRSKKLLEEKIAALEEFKRVTVGREIQMIELKKEVNRLSKELGRPEPYDVSFG
jgi:CheY-like chemotaxis protein/uncharacterized protein YeeX (DUF496 family)